MKKFRPKFFLISLLSLVILASYFLFTNNNLSNVLSSTADYAGVPGVPPALELQGDYEVVVNFSNAAEVTNVTSNYMVIDISGPEAQKIADYSNYYSYGGNIKITSIYPVHLYEDVTYPKIRDVYLKFRKITENNKTFYRSNFYLYYGDTTLELAFLSNLKNLKFSPVFTKESSNVLKREAEKLSQFQINSSLDGVLGFSVRLRGEGAFDVARQLKNEFIELVEKDGNIQKIRFGALMFSSVERSYWDQKVAFGNFKEIRFSNSYAFDIVYREPAFGNIKYRDWVLSADGKSIYRTDVENDITPATPIDVQVSYSGACKNFTFKYNTSCNIVFKFTSTQDQIKTLEEKFKKKNYSLARGSSSTDTYIDPKFTLKLGKITKTKAGYVLVATAKTPSNSRRISFYETGFQFNFSKKPSYFNASTTTLLKIK